MQTLACHEQQAALFATHQVALLRLDVGLATHTLEQYAATLRQHMDLEEGVVLPLYQSRGGQRPGGDVELFLFEHRKLRAYLDEFSAALTTLSATPVDALPTSVLRLLDRQCAYKNLMDHHDRRERTMLYPRLDELTTEEERSRLLPPFFA